MKTFLWDVDDVLFDANPLREKLEALAEERGVDARTLRTPEVLQEIHEEDPKFLPGLVSAHGKELIGRLKGRGVRSVLASTARRKGEDVATPEQVAYQKLKIKLTGLEELVEGEENVRVSDGAKDEIFSEFAGEHTYFIDNDIEHLRAAHLREIRTVHLYGEQLHGKSPESAGEVFREATYAAKSIEKLIPMLEKDGIIEKEEEDKE